MNIGLSTQQANQLRQIHGTNELTTNDWKSKLELITNIFLDPMGLMLLCLSLFYFLVGETKDAIVLLIAYIPVTAVDVLLEFRSNQALKSLRSKISTNVSVYRDNQIQIIKSKELVPNDVIVFEEGQVFTVDGQILQASHLSINESSLTGESEPIQKNRDDLFFSGTSIISGQGLGLVTATGLKSRMGQISKMVMEAKEMKSPLRKKVDRLISIIGWLALFFTLLLFFIHWMRSENILESLIVSLTLGMSAVPEEFPLVFTLYLSLGAWRLSKLGVLVKSLPSVEALGSVDIICTDKTGTLTQGQFQLEEINIFQNKYTSSFIQIQALAACEIHAVDAMDIAIKKFIHSNSDNGPLEFSQNWQMLYDFPFDPSGKHMTHVWNNNEQVLVALKGSVEGIIQHCLLSKNEIQEIQNITNQLSAKGKRILGLAGVIKPKSNFSNENWKTQDRSVFESDLNFYGFLIFSDPVRESVKKAVMDCQNNQIKIKMITGDHLLTAHSVAEQIGLEHDHEYFADGQLLSNSDIKTKENLYLKGSVFSRVLPEQKKEMIQILQNNHHIVAMTGDGINDAPALKQADIGISMGASATDVARSSAKMILLNNDFAGLVHAILQGRRIFYNLQKSFCYLISFHIPIVLLALVPPLLGWPSLLLPIHIILLELVVHPISAYTFENWSDSLTRLPKNPKDQLLTFSQIFQSAFMGIVISLISIFCFYWIFNFGDLNLFNTEPGLFTDKSNYLLLARSFSFAIVLLGNILFVVHQSYPKFNSRFYWTCGCLGLLSLGIFSNQWLCQELHLQVFQWKDAVTLFTVFLLGVFIFGIIFWILNYFLIKKQKLLKFKLPVFLLTIVLFSTGVFPNISHGKNKSVIPKTESINSNESLSFFELSYEVNKTNFQYQVLKTKQNKFILKKIFKNKHKYKEESIPVDASFIRDLTFLLNKIKNLTTEINTNTNTKQIQNKDQKNFSIDCENLTLLNQNAQTEIIQINWNNKLHITSCLKKQSPINKSLINLYQSLKLYR